MITVLLVKLCDEVRACSCLSELCLIEGLCWVKVDCGTKSTKRNCARADL